MTRQDHSETQYAPSRHSVSDESCGGRGNEGPRTTGGDESEDVFPSEKLENRVRLFLRSESNGRARMPWDDPHNQIAASCSEIGTDTETITDGFRILHGARNGVARR